MRRISIISLVFLLSSALQPAIAANVRSFVSKEGKTIVSINGEIVRDDVPLVRNAIKAANDAGRIVSGFRLNSQGGNLLAAIEIAELVRFARVATVVANGATCASACFFIFAAGSDKFASHSAQLGVHGAADESGAETIRSGAATVSMARVAKELGLSDTIIGKMVVTPPTQIVWLSANDLRSIGTNMTGRPAQVKDVDDPSIAKVPMQLSPSAGSVKPRLPAATQQAQGGSPIEGLQLETLQNLIGTHYAEAKPSFSDGVLTGCSVEFAVMARDWTYKQGGYIRIGGSFGLMAVGSNVAAVLKVILHDIDPRTMDFKPSPPDSAYFVSGSRTTKNAVINQSLSDTPGAIFVIHNLDPTLSIIVEGVSSDKVTIAFSRRKGGSDIGAAIETNVTDIDAEGRRKRSPQTTLAFFDCTKTLLDRVLKQ